MFERLKERYLQDRQEQKEKTFFYIENGYFPTWNKKRIFGQRFTALFNVYTLGSIHQRTDRQNKSC